MYACLVLRLA